MSRKLVMGLLATAMLGLAATSTTVAWAAATPAAITAAVADKTRPDTDTKRDADRKPAEVMTFIGVKPGDKVVDLIPGGGYFTRLFSDVVGPKGAVYAFTPAEFAKFSKTALPASGAHPDPARPNITFLTSAMNDFAAPEKLDVVWTSQNYHDLHDDFAAPSDLAVINKKVFAALKPGGVYVVLDHSAVAGSGLAATNTLHRIDAATVKSEVMAAGFKFDGESKVLANPADPRTANVFDAAIKGKTDQFIYRFRKPK
jgi:predicted methyltransferase